MSEGDGNTLDGSRGKPGLMRPLSFKLGIEERGYLVFLTNRYAGMGRHSTDLNTSEVIRRALRLSVVRELVSLLGAAMEKTSREAWFRKCGRPGALDEILDQEGVSLDRLRQLLLEFATKSQKGEKV